MRLLLANPNTTQGVTARIAAVARTVAAPGTEIAAVTGRDGVPYIATRAEAAIAARTTLDLLAEHGAGCDAAVVAAFGDPGLAGARELMPFPVVGMAEAAMLTACMLGQRFAIVTFSFTLNAWYRDYAASLGHAARFAGVHSLDSPFRDVATAAEELEEQLAELCCSVAAGGDVDAVIIGGAPLAGLSRRIAGRVPVPLVDGVEAAVLQAETLVRLAPRKASAGSFRRPAPKPSVGLSPALAALVNGENGKVG